MPSFWDINFRRWVTESPHFGAVQFYTYSSGAGVNKILFLPLKLWILSLLEIRDLITH
jgi:hypothetical protein